MEAFTPAEPAARGFDTTGVWIFDLDNTLYPSDCRLFDLIEHRMGEFIADMLAVPYDEAQHLRLNYYRKFGTTLTGLMEVHKIDPGPFLEYVHDIDLTSVQPNATLRAAIQRLDGRRLIFTNGSRRHAERVATKVGILDLFEDICDIAQCEYVPKPDISAFDRMIRAHGVDAREAAMFEDMPVNLQVPHALGMTTVLVHHDVPADPRQAEIKTWSEPPDHIHHLTDDLPSFLQPLGRKTM